MLRLLIVDDEEEARQGMLECINWRENEIEVIGTCADGRTACGMIVALKPDLVLIDIKMPVLDGLEVIDIIKHQERMDTVFIILSAYEDFNFAQRALRLSADDYLLKPYRPSDVLAAVKRAVSRIEGVKDQARESIGGSFDTIYRYIQKDGMSAGRGSVRYPAQEERHMMQELQLGSDRERLLAALETFFERVQADNGAVAESFIQCCLMLYVNICRLLMENGQECQFENFNSPVWGGDGAIDSVKQTMRGIVVQACDLLQTKRELKTVVAKAVEYIEKHYCDKLTLDVVSSAVFLSPSYLSWLFKQTLGMNFIDYIHTLRIHKAKQMLKDTPAKIYEIAEQVGYDNTKYFSQVFKKYSGITPIQFRIRVNGEVIGDMLAEEDQSFFS